MSWDGFNNAIIANRQKDTFVHGFLDVSGHTIIRNGDLSLNQGRLFVNRDASLNGNLEVGKDITILGRLNVKNFTSQNIINTTTNNYQLIVSEDLSLNGRLFVSGNASLNGNLIIENNNFATTISPNSSSASANTWTTTVNGQTIIWNSSASSVYPSAAYAAYKPFDTFVSSWASSNSNLYSITGDYPTTGPSNTLNINSISGVSSLSGEWLQIYTGGIPLILSNYKLGVGGATQFPKVYYILGSNDNTIWSGIHKGSLSAAPTATNSIINTEITQQGPSYSSYGGGGTLTITVYSGAANLYKYFRIVIPTIFATNGSSVAELLEWNINFTTPSTSSGSLSLDRLTQNQLNVGVGATNALVVNSTGLVGIGTTNPAVALDVVGNLRCTAGYDLNYTTLPTYASNQIGYTTFAKPTINNSLSTKTTLAQAIYITSIQIPSAGVWNILGVLGLQNDPASACNFGLVLYSATSVGTVNTSSAGATAITSAAPSAVNLITNMSYILTSYTSLGMQINYIYSGPSRYIILGAFSGAGGQNDYGTSGVTQIRITRIA